MITIPAMRGFLVVLCFVVSLGSVRAADPDQAVVDQYVDKIGSSLAKGDIVYPVNLVPPAILDAMGGKTALLAAGQAALEQIKAQNIQILSWKATKPYQFVAAASHRYVLIPCDTIVAMPRGKKLHERSYYLGIKDPDATWHFVSGETLVPETFNRFFPDFPKTTVLPPTKQSVE